jgi:hypothetical protein
MKHWDMSAISITIGLQTKEVHRNRNASYDYRYTGSSGKQEVTLKFSQILRELLIALHVTLQRQPNDMGLETQHSDGLAICWVTENLQPHSQEKHWRGLCPRAVCRGTIC